MAGSSVTFTYDDGGDGIGLTGSIRQVIIDWVSDSATGAASGTSHKIVGTLIKAVTIPGAGGSAPTDNYDITLSDGNVTDFLANCKTGLANRDTANTEEVYFFLVDQDSSPLSLAARPVVCDTLAVAISNAGNTKTGRIILYYRR